MKIVEHQASARQEHKSVGAVVAETLRHGWWLVVLVVALVGTISGIQYARAPRIYFVEQNFRIVVLPTVSSSSYDNYQASVWAETIGHALAEGRLTEVIGGFAGVINAQLSSSNLVNGPHSLSASQLQRDLSWSNSGNDVVLTAYWSTPAGASALVSATTAALLTGDLTHVTIWRGAVPPTLVAYAATNGSASAPALDQAHQQAELAQIVLARMALSLPAGLLLLLGWAWLRQVAGHTR